MRIVIGNAAVPFFCGHVLFNTYPVRVTIKRRRTFTVPA